MPFHYSLEPDPPQSSSCSTAAVTHVDEWAIYWLRLAIGVLYHAVGLVHVMCEHQLNSLIKTSGTGQLRTPNEICCHQLRVKVDQEQTRSVQCST